MKLCFKYILPVICVIAAFVISSCSSEPDFSTNPMDKLSFSTDTVRFDTVFAQIGTSTRQFRIYNKSNKPLKVESINLAGGSSNGFSVVVDGERGTAFSNVEIGAKDSLFVFVEVTVNPQNENNPVLISDSLTFRTNGNNQRIRLEAYGQDVIILNKILRKHVVVHRPGKPDTTITKVNTIFNDTTLTGARPFLVYDSLIVAKGGKLNLAPGVRLYFHEKALCRIDGRISCKGTVQDPVVFRGDRTDKMLNDLPYDLYTGLWRGVSISPDSYDNVMEHTQIRNGQYALRLDSAATDNQKLTLLNCKFTNVTGTVFSAFNCKVTAWGCEFSNGGEDVVALTGGIYDFVHCTMMNHFLFGSESPSAVRLCNYKLTGDGAWVFFPLKQANFSNCILYGRRTTEINFDNKPKGYAINTDFKYHFDYCLIKANGEDDADFVSTLWNKDPKFINVGENNRFDLRLDSASVAVNAGRYGSAQACPTDMYGNSRLADGKPDLGAYERTQK